MVRWAEKPSLSEASCCSVEVVKGGAALLLLDRQDLQLALRLGLQSGVNFSGTRAVVDRELLEFFAVEMGQPGDKILALGIEVGFDGPVFACDEFFDLLLALDDEPQRRTLYTPGRQPAAHLFPQQRREVETHEVIERAPRLLGVDEIL